MSRLPIALVLAFALIAVPAAFAKGREHRAVRVQGVCTKQSTSKLKLSREDRGIEIEFEVDQNRNGVPWRVRLSRNGRAVASFIAKTHGPSGSFEVRRVVAGRLGADRIRAVATRSSEICKADSAKPRATAATAGAATNGADDSGHDVGDDHGHDSGSHS